MYLYSVFLCLERVDQNWHCYSILPVQFQRQFVIHSERIAWMYPTILFYIRDKVLWIVSIKSTITRKKTTKSLFLKLICIFGRFAIVSNFPFYSSWYSIHIQNLRANLHVTKICKCDIALKLYKANIPLAHACSYTITSRVVTLSRWNKPPAKKEPNKKKVRRIRFGYEGKQ